MQLFVELALYGFAAPIAIAWLVLRVCLAISPLQSLAAACGLAGAFAVGGRLLPWLPLFEPTLHWHWLPVAVIIACLLTGGATAAAKQVLPNGPGRQVFNLVAILLSAASAGWLLVPDWETLANVRVISSIGLAFSIALIGYACQSHIQKLQRIERSGEHANVQADQQPSEQASDALAWHATREVLAVRWSTLMLGYMLALIALAASLLMFLAESAKFAQLGGVLLAGTLGWLAIAWMYRTKVLQLASALAGYMVALHGLLLCGFLNSWSGIHWGCYSLVAISPLCLLCIPRHNSLQHWELPEKSEDSETATKSKGQIPWVGMLVLHTILIGCLVWAALSAAPAEW